MFKFTSVPIVSRMLS